MILDSTSNNIPRFKLQTQGIPLGPSETIYIVRCDHSLLAVYSLGPFGPSTFLFLGFPRVGSPTRRRCFPRATSCKGGNTCSHWGVTPQGVLTPLGRDNLRTLPQWGGRVQCHLCLSPTSCVMDGTPPSTLYTLVRIQGGGGVRGRIRAWARVSGGCGTCGVPSSPIPPMLVILATLPTPPVPPTRISVVCILSVRKGPTCTTRYAQLATWKPPWFQMRFIDFMDP